MPFCIQCRTEVPSDGRVCPGCGALQPRMHERFAVTPGATFDLGHARVVFEAKVGDGGMGVVWRGWLFHAPGGPRAGAPPEPIALKVLRPQALVRRELRALFMNEAETIKRLLHPNIVRYYDLFEWSSGMGSSPPPRSSVPPASAGRVSQVPSSQLARVSDPAQSMSAASPLVLAMEYVVGDTLEEVIARHVARAQLAGSGVLPGMAFRRAFYYFEQLLGALAATHALGMVHRDVKPSNVLIRQDGILKLTDFGIARLATTALGTPVAAAQTSGFAAGTGAYMSPEQVLSQPLDGRSDLYAAALVLYEMLSGQQPFYRPGDTEFVIRQRQVEMAVPPIRTWLAQAPPALDALFARALAKDPAYRFASAIDMGNAFRVGLGLPDNPGWEAQQAFALAATHSQIEPAPSEPAHQAQQKRMATLREFVVKGYQTLKLDAAR